MPALPEAIREAGALADVVSKLRSSRRMELSLRENARRLGRRIEGICTTCVWSCTCRKTCAASS